MVPKGMRIAFSALRHAPMGHWLVGSLPSCSRPVGSRQPAPTAQRSSLGKDADPSNRPTRVRIGTLRHFAGARYARPESSAGTPSAATRLIFARASAAV